MPKFDARRPCPARWRVTRRVAGALSAFSVVLFAAGCGPGKPAKSGSSQAAARVNSEEVTVHQINHVLQQQRGLRPEHAASASRQILDLLVDQELAIQRTRELKIDQDPRVILQLDAARREVLARAYAEHVGATAVKPGSDEVRQYIDARPLLYRDRRVYEIHELAIEATPEQVSDLRAAMQRSAKPSDFMVHLKSTGLRFSSGQGTRAAEQLPANVLAGLAGMKDSQMVLLPAPSGALVVLLVGSRAEPADEARSQAAVAQLLLGEAKRKQLVADVAALRATAKIEWLGTFARDAASAPVAAAVPIAVAASAPAPSASGIAPDAISRGMGAKP